MARAPAPLVADDVDVSDHPWFPLHHRRLRKSRFWLRASDAVKVASVELWCEAFITVPAGSLPDDDIFLAEATGYGRKNVAQWLDIKSDVMAAWTLCSDGRYYHRVVCEVASDIYERTDAKRRLGRERQKRHRDRISKIIDLAAGDGATDAPITRDKGTTGQDKTEQNKDSRAGEKNPETEKRLSADDLAGPDNLILADYFEDQRNKTHIHYPSTEERRKSVVWHMAKGVLEVLGASKAAAGKCVGQAARDFNLDADEIADIALRVFDMRPPPARPTGFFIGCARHYAQERDDAEKRNSKDRPDTPAEWAAQRRLMAEYTSAEGSKIWDFPAWYALPGGIGCRIFPDIQREFGFTPWAPPAEGEFE